MILALVLGAAAAGLAIPPGEAASAWAAPLVLAGLADGPALVAVRVEGEVWVLEAASPGGAREARIGAPTTARGREDVALLAASLLRAGPAVALPDIAGGAKSPVSWGGGGAPPQRPPRIPAGTGVGVGATGENAGGVATAAAPAGVAPEALRSGSAGPPMPVATASAAPPVAAPPVAAPPAAPPSAIPPTADPAPSNDALPQILGPVPAATVPPPAVAQTPPAPVAAPPSLLPVDASAVATISPPAAAARTLSPASPAPLAPPPDPPGAAPHLSLTAGLTLSVRDSLAPSAGALVGGSVRLPHVPDHARFAVSAYVSGTLPTRAGDVDPAARVTGARAAALAELRAPGRLAPFVAAGPAVSLLVFAPSAADAPQTGITPGVVVRAGAGWPISALARLELVVDGGADSRAVRIGRDDEVVQTLGRVWASAGVFVHFE
ncbi:MAG: hypothetical protein V4850_25645 [Myxococcota bacterium]